MFSRENSIKGKYKAKDAVAAAFALVLMAGKPAYAETVPPYRTVGVDVVGTGSDPVADAIKPQADGRSKMELAMAEVARVDGMTPEESVAYRLAMRNVSNMKSTTVGEAGLRGKVIVMADGSKGGYNAQRVSVELPLDTKVRVGTYTYVRDGKTYEENFYVIEGCANPAVDAAEDRVVEVPKPIPAPISEANRCFPSGDYRRRTESVPVGAENPLSKYGITGRDYIMLSAPTGATFDDARAYFQEYARAHRDVSTVFVLEIDADGNDCHPEKIYCVSIIKGRVTLKPLEAHLGRLRKPYNDLDEASQKAWLAE